MNWMHQNLNCCHLDLAASNIMVTNANFLSSNSKTNDDDDSVVIDPRIKIKIADFGLSEVFTDDNHLCYKRMESQNHDMKCTQLFDGQVFDGKKADMWSMGIILFNLCFGVNPYRIQNEKLDVCFVKLKAQNLREIVEFRCSKICKDAFWTESTESVLLGMLDFNQESRFDCNDIMKHKWFETYYKKYGKRIASKNESCKARLEMLQANMKKMRCTFPYYKLPFKMY